tara:strand:+ start:732 stop:1214 length:483 start_codon:yes stop_codon:yes gene_type:complete
MIVAQVVLAWIYGHVLEYCAHRYLLHDHKNFSRFFKNHFGTHHYISRKNDMYDVGYAPVLSSKFEVFSLTFAAVIHLPVLLYFPYAYLTLLFSLFSYYFLHRKAHTDTSWGKRWMPWHYEHHMGKNQHMNWGVRLPLVDFVVGTYTKQNLENQGEIIHKK